MVLARLAADFTRLHPGIELELIAEDRKADPVEEDLDLVIRVNPSPDERLVGRRILEDRRLLVAAPQIRLPTGEGVTEIDAIDRIGMPLDALWQVETADGVRCFRPNARLRYSSFLMVREALLAGSGFALAPRLMVSDDIEAGRLISFGTASGAPVEIWILQNSRRLTSRRCRLFMDAVVARFHDDGPG
jgi:DNA-binding transcriptional LysR family regulator